MSDKSYILAIDQGTRFFDSIESLKKLNPHRKHFLPAEASMAKENYKSWLRHVKTGISVLEIYFVR